jgi:hypothetical protein
MYFSPDIIKYVQIGDTRIPVLYSKVYGNILDPSGPLYRFAVVITKEKGILQFWIGKITHMFIDDYIGVCIPFKDKPFFETHRSVDALSGIILDIPAAWNHGKDTENELAQLFAFVDKHNTISFELYQDDEALFDATFITIFDLMKLMGGP